MKYRFRDWLTSGFRGIWLKGYHTVWDDLSISLTRTQQGANDLPHFDDTNLGLLFPQNDTTEIAYIIVQMKHSKKLGSAIQPHIHYIQSSVNKPIFKMDYKFYGNGDTVPSEFTTVSTADGNKGIFTYSSGSILQIANFPHIEAPASENVSAHFEAKLYRDDNDVTGDVLGKYIDLHIEKDALGSAGVFTKWTEY